MNPRFDGTVLATAAPVDVQQVIGDGREAELPLQRPGFDLLEGNRTSRVGPNPHRGVDQAPLLVVITEHWLGDELGLRIAVFETHVGALRQGPHLLQHSGSLMLILVVGAAHECMCGYDNREQNRTGTHERSKLTMD